MKSRAKAVIWRATGSLGQCRQRAASYVVRIELLARYVSTEQNDGCEQRGVWSADVHRVSVSGRHDSSVSGDDARSHSCTPPLANRQNTRHIRALSVRYALSCETPRRKTVQSATTYDAIVVGSGISGGWAAK